jgi:hypothetical protein
MTLVESMARNVNEIELFSTLHKFQFQYFIKKRFTKLSITEF